MIQPHKLAIQAGFTPSLSPKYSGEFFSIPPRVLLLDKVCNMYVSQ
jgi:hypothetical protein